jgi:hypothetical protein
LVRIKTSRVAEAMKAVKDRRGKELLMYPQS